MKTVQFDAYGPPEVLHVGEMEPPLPGPGQLQLRVSATGVNPADCKYRSGSLRDFRPLSFPQVVGHDVAGTVTSTGPGVTQFKVGDQVAATVEAGGYAEFAVANEAACAHLPKNLDFVQAAALPCAALTGVEMIEEGVRPQPGQTVLVTGATGGVGRFAVNAALTLGARVVAAVRPQYHEEARRLGANKVISLEDDPPVDLQFDHVADTVGGPAVAKLCKRMSSGGRIITVTNTPIDAEGLPSPPTFFPYHADGALLENVMAAVARGDITMPVVRRMPFSAAAEAHRLMEAGGLSGRLVLEP